MNLNRLSMLAIQSILLALLINDDVVAILVHVIPSQRFCLHMLLDKPLATNG